MAQKPDGKGAKTERVTFTRPAAERIAKAVRTVEQGDRGSEGLTFTRVSAPSVGPAVRMAYYTASSTWSRVSFSSATSTFNTKVIQFAFPTGQTATALCVNHFVTLTVQSTVATLATRQISVMKEAGMWRVIAAEC